MNNIKSKKTMKKEGWGWTADPEDWTEVNTEEDGDIHYGVKLWPGAGYWLYLYSVWADDAGDALNRVAEWCAENEPGMVIKPEDAEEDINYIIGSNINDDPEAFGFTEEEAEELSNKELVEKLREKNQDVFWQAEDDALEELGYALMDEAGVYVRLENLFIDRWPEDYVSKSESKNEKLMNTKHGNIVTELHDAAKVINKKLAEKLGLSDGDFFVIMNRYGLWIEWSENDSYGVSVEADNGNIAVSSMEDMDIVSQEILGDQVAPLEIVDAIDKVVKEDGVLNLAKEEKK